MDTRLKLLLAYAAFVGPLVLGALSVELAYDFHARIHETTLFIAFYGLSLVAPLFLIINKSKCPAWVTYILGLSYVAVSLGLAVVCGLMVAAAHGDAL
jgi:hypothetical protein